MSQSLVLPFLPLAPGEEEIAIRTAVRSICESFGEGYQRAKYEAGEAPTELWQALSKSGFAALNVGEEWGGGGMGMAGISMVLEECARTGNASVFMIVSSAMGGTLLERHGTDAQKEHWLRGVADGSVKMAFAITEPDAGSNSHEIRTELRRDGDGYVLSGQKVWTSGVEDAAAVVVVARFRREEGTLGKPCLCIVDVDAPGFTRTPIRVPYMAAETQWTMFFDNVRIDADRLLGAEEGGLRVVFDGLNPERIGLAALATGVALRALDKATAYACEREVWGKPIGTHQAVAHPLAKAKIEVEMARLMTQKAAILWDCGDPSAGEASNMAKYAASEAASHAVDAAIQTHGGNGVAVEYGISDLYWVIRTLRIAPVSSEMVLNHIAEHTLGLPKSY